MRYRLRTLLIVLALGPPVLWLATVSFADGIWVAAWIAAALLASEGF